jgi:hypothetical protein
MNRWSQASLLLLTTSSLSCAAEIRADPAELELDLPVRIGFENVADALQPSCGTLDCHGQPARNLRLFGGRGLRLSPDDTPLEGATTPAEYDATYWAIVGLEPELLGTVVEQGGVQPERLLMIRKGRGTTRHKGGTIMHPDDDLDQCLVGWLAGTILVDRCQVAAKLSVGAQL